MPSTPARNVGAVLRALTRTPVAPDGMLPPPTLPNAAPPGPPMYDACTVSAWFSVVAYCCTAAHTSASAPPRASTEIAASAPASAAFCICRRSTYASPVSVASATKPSNTTIATATYTNVWPRSSPHITDLPSHTHLPRTYWAINNPHLMEVRLAPDPAILLDRSREPARSRTPSDTRHGRRAAHREACDAGDT